jgi:hypothetical protein
MSTPSTDYSQQILAYLEVWREILQQSTTAAAGLAPMLPTGMPFMPPMPTGMPGIPPMPTGMPGMPPMPPPGPVAPPAPADYAQQLFGYLQAWRHYLEQMTGAMPGSAPPPSAHQGDDQYPPPPPGNPPLIDKRPVYGDESARPNPVDGPVSNVVLSLPPHDEGETASVSLFGGKRPADGSGIWPPNNTVLVRPATEDGTMAPSNFGNKIDRGDVFKTPAGPVTDGRGGGPAASHVLRPPIYDWGNQWGAPLRGVDVRRAPVTPETRAQRIPDTPAGRAPAQVSVDVASSHRAAMDRVTLDATPKVEVKSNFREPGPAASP